MCTIHNNCPSKYNISSNQFSQFFHTFGHNFTVHLNAKNILLGCHTTNSHGNPLLQTIFNLNLQVKSLQSYLLINLVLRVKNLMYQTYLLWKPLTINSQIFNLHDLYSDHFSFIRLGLPGSKQSKLSNCSSSSF